MDPLPLSQEPLWSKISPVVVAGAAVRRTPGSVAIPTSEGECLVTAWADGVRLQFGRRDLPDYPILIAEPEEQPASLTDNEAGVVLAWGNFRLTISREPFAFTLEKAGRIVQRSATDGHFVREHRLPPFARLPDGRWFAALDLVSGEPVYGLGEKWGRLDKRGQLVRFAGLRCARRQWRARLQERALLLVAGRGRTVRLGRLRHTPATVTHGVGHPLWSQRAYGLCVEEDALDLFIWAGDTGADLLRAYGRT